MWWRSINDASAGDLNGDGEYEIVLKREDGSRDNSRGGATGSTTLEAYTLDGTIDGQGKVIGYASKNYVNENGMIMDGVRPSVVMCRGYYTRTVLAAWDWRDGKLTQRWVFDSDVQGAGKDGKPNQAYAGQGNHNLSVADVDGDGKDEIAYGAMCIDDDGKGLWTTGLRHGDAMHVSDLDPRRLAGRAYYQTMTNRLFKIMIKITMDRPAVKGFR